MNNKEKQQVFYISIEKKLNIKIISTRISTLNLDKQ